MGNKRLNWCLKIKDGIKIFYPNENLSKSYLNEAKSSLLRAQKDYEDKDFLWTTVAIYYSEYYALYSFLQKIGLKCENHSCSIMAVEFLLGNDKIKIINEHKEKRIDAQYYMKYGKDKEIQDMLNQAKIFISDFDDLVSNMNETDIKSYRDKFLSNL